MSKFIVEAANGKTFEYDNRPDAEKHKSKIEKDFNMDATIKMGGEPDGGEVVEEPTHTVEHPEPTETVEADVINSPEALAKDPISWLNSHNSDFVNTIKGTPAISKMGFRFIQAQFGITTESKVVETFDDPTGVIVWAKAELPDGQAAEAHGEGYLTESQVDDNEFVRYADTRAKNRAISDLTSAGALAVSELSGE